MTAQSDWPHASSRADEADDETAERDDLPEVSPEDSVTSPAMDADPDPDVIVVSAHEDLLDEDDLDDDLDDAPKDEPALDDDIIAATVVPPAADEPAAGQPAEPTVLEPTVLEPTVVEPTVVEPTVLEPTMFEPTVDEDEPAAGEPAVPEPAVVAGQTGRASGSAGLSPHWHDIQAQFVDDPRGSVELAVAAVDEAVTELVEAVNRRRAGLVPAAGVPDDPESTEQLREALRSCRRLCQNLADISERFARPETLAS